MVCFNGFSNKSSISEFCAPSVGFKLHLIIDLRRRIVRLVNTGSCGPVEHLYVVLLEYHRFSHHGVQQPVEEEEKGDHLPAQVDGDPDQMPPEHSAVVYFGRIVFTDVTARDLKEPFAQEDADGNVENEQQPMAANQKQESDEQLSPKFWYIPLREKGQFSMYDNWF